MRLTLRTLLAYLEDELKPAESKEIGQKIAESPVATSLAQRIREVMRRRRLSVEDLNETGLDPNLVAEYLDGSLTPQEVADVERVCLGSDAHLAEVAACHQILTLVLGEPIEISTSSRERMYALADDGTVAKSDIPMPAAVTPTPVDQIESTPFPSHLQRTSRWRSALPLLIPLVLIGMWVVLIRFDPSLNFFAAAPGDNGNGMTIAAADPDEVDGSGQAPDFVPKQKQEPETVSASAEPGDPEQGIDPPPPPDMPEPGTTDVEEPEAAEKSAPLVAKIPTDEPSGNVPETPAAAPQPPVPTPPEPGKPAERKVVGRYRSTAGVLLSFDEKKQGWYPVPYELELLEQTSVVVPVPFSAIFEMQNEAPLLDLKGGTKAKLITDSQAANLGIKLEEGRVVLEALNPQPTPFACQTGTLDWRFELNQAGTRVGIEMEPLQVYGAEHPLPENYFRLKVIVTSGAVRLASESGQITLSEGQEIVLHDPSLQTSINPDIPDVNFSVPGLLKPEMVEPYELTPDWMKPESGIISTIQQMYIDEFATRFRPELPAAESLERLLEDPRPRIAQYTVICLGLIDDVSDLIKTMRVSEFEDPRLAAASEVRLWLPRHPEQRDEYLSRLELSFPGDDAAQLDRLLWGFSTDDARDPIASQSLIALLDHDRPILSELAFLEMARLTGLEESYKALITPTQRRAWTNRWKRMVRDQGTILSPQANE